MEILKINCCSVGYLATHHFCLSFCSLVTCQHEYDSKSPPPLNRSQINGVLVTDFSCFHFIIPNQTILKYLLYKNNRILKKIKDLLQLCYIYVVFLIFFLLFSLLKIFMNIGRWLRKDNEWLNVCVYEKKNDHDGQTVSL